VTYGEGKVLPPALTDPVVIDGVKYRIRSFDTGEQTGWIRMAYCRTYFRPHLEATVIADALVWDRVAGVWRIPEHLA